MTIIYQYDGLGNRTLKRVLENGFISVTHYVRDATGNILATYVNQQLESFHIYGSGRLGTYHPRTDDYGKLILGYRNYELTNHLGNVLAVISDRKQQDFTADIISATDYYPFGMQIKSRTFEKGKYRYGFNGKEKDRDFGKDHVNFGARIYDSEIGKWLSVDPLAQQMPSWSPYNYTFNNPLSFIDLDGRAPEDVIILIGGSYKGHPYGHVAIGIIDANGNAIVYDFGRYRATSGTFNESGDGVLRVHSSLESYIEGENATGRTTSVYRFKSTLKEDVKVVEYFKGLMEKSTDRKAEVKDKRWSFKLEDDYHATRNNCTTLSLCGLEEALPGVAKELKDPKESKGRGLGWKEKLADKTIGNNSIGNKIFMPADLKKNIDTKKKHIDSKQYSNKIKE